MNDEREWMTTEEAGKKLHRSPRMTRRYVHEKLLESIRNGKQILVSKESVERLRQELHPDQEEETQEEAPQAAQDASQEQEGHSLQEMRGRLSAGIQQLWTGFFTRKQRDHIIADLEYKLKVENERNEKIQDELLALVQQLRSHPADYDRRAHEVSAKTGRLWKWAVGIGVLVGLFFWLVY
jgi:hypothetical protein